MLMEHAGVVLGFALGPWIRPKTVKTTYLRAVCVICLPCRIEKEVINTCLFVFVSCIVVAKWILSPLMKLALLLLIVSALCAYIR